MKMSRTLARTGAVAASAVGLIVAFAPPSSATARWYPSTNVLEAYDNAQDGHSAVARISIGGSIRKTVWAPNGVGTNASAVVTIPSGYTTGTVYDCIGDINQGAGSIRGCVGRSVSL